MYLQELLYLQGLLQVSWWRVCSNNPWALREKIYATWKPDDVRKLLEETGNASYRYEPLTQTLLAPRVGKYVNVSEHEFRHGKHENAWPPSDKTLAVFVFGGSTTFGWGVADWETVPAFLEEKLRNRFRSNIAVYNFGKSSFFLRTNYFSSSIY